jgi:hypothetical protein
MTEATIRGSLDEAERETLAVLAARRDEIQNGHLGDVPWFLAIVGQVSDILRRRRTVQKRREART